jgi:hypothetical protein
MMRIQVDAIFARLEALRARLPEAVAVAVSADVADSIRHSVTQYLSGQRLRRRTGNLQRSVTASAKVEPTRIDRTSSEVTTITGTVGTALGYGRAHEEGFHKTVQVRGHMRRKIALRRNSRGKLTKKSTERLKRVLRRTSTGGGNAVFVRSHAMRMDIRAKRYIRDAVLAKQPELRIYAQRSLAILGRTGAVATLSQIRGGGNA